MAITHQNRNYKETVLSHLITAKDLKMGSVSLPPWAMNRIKHGLSQSTIMLGEESLLLIEGYYLVQDRGLKYLSPTEFNSLYETIPIS